MKPLSESLLDIDYDVTVEEIKNWPRLSKRLQQIPNAAITPAGKDIIARWSDTTVMSVLTEAFKKDIGGPQISKRSAHDMLLDDNDPCIFAMFKRIEPGDNYAQIIIIGTYDECMMFDTQREGSNITVKCMVNRCFTARMQTMVAANWAFKRMPHYMYELIKENIIKQ